MQVEMAQTHAFSSSCTRTWRPCARPAAWGGAGHRTACARGCAAAGWGSDSRGGRACPALCRACSTPFTPACICMHARMHGHTQLQRTRASGHPPYPAGGQDVVEANGLERVGTGGGEWRRSCEGGGGSGRRAGPPCAHLQVCLEAVLQGVLIALLPRRVGRGRLHPESAPALCSALLHPPASGQHTCNGLIQMK